MGISTSSTEEMITILIVEGPDGSGKSTLVKSLSEVLGLPIEKRVVGADTKPMVPLRAWTERNVYEGFQYKIFDRHRLISGPIYDPVMQRPPSDGFCDLGWVMEMTTVFYAARPIIIYCMPPINTVLRNVHDQATDNGAVNDRTEAIYAGYAQRVALDFSRGVGRLYSYPTTALSDIISYVRKELLKR